MKTFKVCVVKDVIISVAAMKATVATDQTHDLSLMGDGVDMANCVARFNNWLYYIVEEIAPEETATAI